MLRYTTLPVLLEIITEKDSRRKRFALRVLFTLLYVAACFGQVFMVQVLEKVGPELVTNMERKRDKKESPITLHNIHHHPKRESGSRD
jgi:Na+-transporting methylmalonyl-CoA/oxaloacetate decarboxylase gamma subunit